MNFGYDPTALVGDADLVMVLESDVPWFPSQAQPARRREGDPMRFDPLFTRIPICGFFCDLGLIGGTDAILALWRSLNSTAVRNALQLRRDALAKERAAMTARWQATCVIPRARSPAHPAWVSRCISEAKDADAIVVNEYTLHARICSSFENPIAISARAPPRASGWGAGAALGANSPRPNARRSPSSAMAPISSAIPSAVHHAAAMHGLPVLFVVMNNSIWGAVRSSTLAMYPDGLASKSNDRVHEPRPLPALEQICTAAGGYGERVEDPPNCLRRCSARMHP